MDGCTVSHAPVSVVRHNQRAPWNRYLARVSARASSSRRTLRFRTAVLPSRRQTEWSAVRISSCPLSTVTRCTVMTQDDVKLSGAVFVRSGRYRPACFTGRRVTPLPSFPYPSPTKRSRIKASCSACSTGPKASPMLGVTRCTNVPPV